MLAKSPNQISVGDIVRTLEESTAITDCAEREVQLCGVCNLAGDCLSRWVWIEASKAMFDRLDKITIGGLITKRKDSIVKAQARDGRQPNQDNA